MADPIDPVNPNDDLPPDLADVPYGQEPLEVEDDAPRRKASARFVVDSEVGSDAALRDAMDPANQSLADALRLSFRVLQVVILVLVVIFLFSGVHTVKEGESGVATMWGKIVSGEEGLSAGPKFGLPYPAGDLVIFETENRKVDLPSAFSPASRGRSSAELRERADITVPLIPGQDGSLLTRDGDLAHLKLAAKYVIDHPIAFVNRVSDDEKTRDANRLVQLALQRATIHTAAELSLQDLIDATEDTRLRIQRGAQEVLDSLKCGIMITQVQITEPSGPLALEKSKDDVAAAKVDAARRVEGARQAAAKTLDSVAGEATPKLLKLIDQYEKALERGDQDQCAAQLTAINTVLDSKEVSGEVSDIIQYARSYQSQIESTLGADYRRFQSLLPAYRQDPQRLIAQLWYEAYSDIARRPDTEIIQVPDPVNLVRLNLTGSALIQDLRRRMELQRRAQESQMQNYNPNPTILQGSEQTIGQSGRLLNKQGKPNSPNQ